MKNHNKSRRIIYSFLKHFLVLNGNACAGAPAAPQDDPTGGNCQDINESCPNWEVHCSSADYGPWMAENCAKTCGKCGGGNVCTKTDNDPSCAKYKQQFGCHGQYEDWLATNCAKTCTC